MEGLDMTTLDTAARAMETPTGKFLLNLSALLFGAVLTVITSLILFNIVGFRDTADAALKAAQAANNRNDVQDLRLTNSDLSRAEIKQDIGILRGDVHVHDIEIQKNSDSIDRLDSTQKQLLKSLRPGN